MALSNVTACILSDKAKPKQTPPAMDVNVVPDEVCAGMSHVAADNSGWENAAMRSDVVKLDVFHSDKGLGCTSCIAASKRVKHTSWTSTTRLLLLLRTNIDVPPDWVVNYNVSVGNI